MTELNVPGMSLAPGVVEKIVSIAANEVEGVAALGEQTTGDMRSMLNTKATQGVEIAVDENNELHITLRVEMYFGYVLPDVANALRNAVADAISSQVGMQVASVDVYVDGLQLAR